MSEQKLAVAIHYSSESEAGLQSHTDFIDFGSECGDVLEDKESRDEFKKLLTPLIKFLHPEAAWWCLIDECPECGGINDEHKEGCSCNI